MTITVPADAQAPPIIRPTRFAHVVLRTSRFAEMQRWYHLVLGAETAFENGHVAFLSYDEEHHRVALVNIPGLAPQPAGVAGVHHFAFTYDTLGQLLETYRRLSAAGVAPVWPVNHGPTTSLYYADPDGNQVELQVDNFDTAEEADAFFASEAFGLNPIGVEFDPDELYARHRAGEDERELKRRPAGETRGVEHIALR